jgi:hypothetical protein
VVVTSKGQSATAQWADFDVKGNTALLGGGPDGNVVVDTPVKDATDPLKRNIITGDRLRMDLTTGVNQFESDPAAPVASQKPPVSALINEKTPATSASPPATRPASAEERFKGGCTPGRQCGLFFPEQAKKKAIDTLKKKGIDVP